MGWKGVTVTDQRVRFIAEYLRGYFPFTKLCYQFSISRKTGYKWVERYKQEGLEGLSDRSHRTCHCPHMTDEAIVQARGKHPTWGPKKLLTIPIFPPSQLPPIS
jgi:putative transposase